MDKYFSTFEVAKICQVSPGSVTRWIHDGKLAASVTAGGHHRVQADNLLKLLRSLRMPIPAELALYEQQIKILIVDDEVGIRQLLRSIINKYYPDINIEEAEEGFPAGWKAHGFHPDLVLLDIMLPGMDGFRVCQFIRNNPELKRTKIIVITAVQEPEAREKMLKLGADDFITKPFNVEDLKQKIEAQLNFPEGTHQKYAACD